mmetsp:Transcript_573/g.1239  ORF Transcript_573/g.1239 Transcript_573/m.1239 type:complete len:251 (-) Transcript_573:16-768(-)
MARKSMAAAAVSVASSSSFCDNPFSTDLSSSHLLRGVSCMRVPPEMTNTFSTNKVSIQSDKAKNDITKTATWLERAETLLLKKTESNQVQKEIEEEMKEISHLITEAPAILAISADLPKVLENTYEVEPSNRFQASIQKLQSCPDLRILCNDSDMGHHGQSVSTPTAGKRKHSLSDDENTTGSPNNPMKLLASLSSQAAPVPIDANDDAKLTAPSSNTNNSVAIPNNNVDAEDAKTFVNFLQSVVHVNKK